MSYMNHWIPEANAVQRVTQLPLVRSAVQSVTSAYSEVKGRYPLLAVVGTAAELSVRSAALAAAPLIHSLETPNLNAPCVPLSALVEVANGYACVGLDQLERSFPVLHQSTEEVMGHLRDALFLTLDDVQLRVLDGLDAGLERLERLSDTLWSALRVLQDSQAARVAASSLDELLNHMEDTSAYYLPLPPTMRREWERRVQELEDEDEGDEPGLWTRLRSLLLGLSLQLHHRMLKLRQRLEGALRTLGGGANMVGLGRVLEVLTLLLQQLQLFLVSLVFRAESLQERALTQVKGQAAVLAELGPVRQLRGLPSQVQEVLKDLQELAKILLQLLVNSTPLYNMLQQPSEQEVEDFLNQEEFLSDGAFRRSSANSLFLKAMDGRSRRRKSLYSRTRRGSGSSGSPQAPGPASTSPANGRRGSPRQEGGDPEPQDHPSDSTHLRRASATDMLLGPLMQFVSQSQKAFEYLSPGKNSVDDGCDPVVGTDEN